MDNERRADLGVAAIRAAATQTNVWEADTAEIAIKDVLAYIAHACDRADLNPRAMFDGALESYFGDEEDGPCAVRAFDGSKQSYATYMLRAKLRPLA